MKIVSTASTLDELRVQILAFVLNDRDHILNLSRSAKPITKKELHAASHALTRIVVFLEYMTFEKEPTP